MRYQEINFDGLVGPTHNYAGLSRGNVASSRHKGQRSNPREAALQGLAKARALAVRGCPQAVLPPHERPSIAALRGWGFGGHSDEEVLAGAAAAAPELLAAASSASAMWTANAATVTPSVDAADGRAHFTPANLVANLHRSLEADFTRRVLRAIFDNGERFAVHAPLPASEAMADEGAANHTRLCAGPAGKGLHLFVYGRSVIQAGLPRPRRHPARQTLEAAQAVARSHGLSPEQCLFLQQAPAAIDAGVFHNDVIATGHGDLLICHEDAYAGGGRDLQAAADAFQRVAGKSLQVVVVRRDQLTVREAVRAYLFNSQLVEDSAGRRLLVVPAECTRSRRTRALLEAWTADPDVPIDEVLPFDLRQSMRNGGGPACLRLRVPLNAGELRHLRGRVLLDQTLYDDLHGWICRHYRDHLTPADLDDPLLLEESRRALDELTDILHLPALYPFQQ